MTMYRACTALPHTHRDRAMVALRGDLTRQILADGDYELPDWSTLRVTGPEETYDAKGGICFEYQASVNCLSGSARAGRR